MASHPASLQDVRTGNGSRRSRGPTGLVGRAPRRRHLSPTVRAANRSRAAGPRGGGANGNARPGRSPSRSKSRSPWPQRVSAVRGKMRQRSFFNSASRQEGIEFRASAVAKSSPGASFFPRSVCRLTMGSVGAMPQRYPRGPSRNDRYEVTGPIVPAGRTAQPSGTRYLVFTPRLVCPIRTPCHRPRCSAGLSRSSARQPRGPSSIRPVW